MSVEINDILANRYEIIRSIGRGGMADVFLAFDTRRSVNLALKVLRDDIAEDSVFVKRFRREAQTLARLQHPNIVRFYGMEEDENQVFITMDFINGTTLRKELIQKTSAFPLERIAAILLPICSALNYAHNEGMIHCDVKPANIMIERTGKVLLADFGIARLGEGATTATMVGAGTPAYMAPEQILGKDPTPQTDIYSLGIVLYEMLTGGERPFTGEGARTTGSTGEKVRWEQLHTKPPSLRTINPAISVEVEKVVNRCLEKDPAKRYASVLDLAQAFSECAPQGASDTVYVPQVQTETPKVITPPLRVNPQRKGEFASPTSSKAQTQRKTRGVVIAVVLIPLFLLGIVGAFLLSRGNILQNIFNASGFLNPTPTSTTEPTKFVPIVVELPTITPAPTFTLEPTSTITPTVQPTAIGVSGVLSGNAKCRRGAGELLYSFDINTILVQGNPVIILGRNYDKSWLKILTESQKECWVLKGFVSANYDINKLPVTLSPKLDQIYYAYVVASCSTKWNGKVCDVAPVCTAKGIFDKFTDSTSAKQTCLNDTRQTGTKLCITTMEYSMESEIVKESNGSLFYSCPVTPANSVWTLQDL
jgi:serine/threonine protein kinase